MRALLLAAGFGTRLRPLTNRTPKCLVKIAGRPLLDYWLRDLAEAGFDEFLINTHYLAAQVQQFIADHPLRSQVTLVHEETLLGTGGTLMANQDFFTQGTTLLAHADNLCFCPWKEFVSAHQSRPEGTIMTMMTFETPEPQQCGIVEVDAHGVVRGFYEKVPNPPGNLANAAVYLVEPDLIKIIKDSDEHIHDISTQVLPNLLGRIHAWQNRDTLIDIGSPERLETAQAILSARPSNQSL